MKRVPGRSSVVSSFDYVAVANCTPPESEGAIFSIGIISEIYGKFSFHCILLYGCNKKVESASDV